MSFRHRHHSIRPRGRQLRVLATIIKDRWPDLYVECIPWTTNTDRPCGRLRIPGKGRNGYKLTVRQGRDGWNGEVLLSHESGETYRENAEVAQWIEKRAGGPVDEAWVHREPRCGNFCACDENMARRAAREA